MYIILPLVILIASLAVAVYLASRKFMYLKKLDPSVVQDAPTTMRDFGNEMFPEAVVLWKKIDVRQHTGTLSVEAEKLLRKLRLAFLKIDTLTHSLIRKMRKKTQQVQLQEQHKLDQAVAEEATMVPAALSISDLRGEEQHLIMEIAKDPKNADLYKQLGAIYVKIGDTEDARHSFETALELDPDDLLVKNKLRKLSTK